MKLLISLLTLIVLSTSCSASKENISDKPMNDNTLSGHYTITSLDKNTPIPNTLTINFDDKTNKVSGFLGCNTFFGTYTIAKNEVRFSNIASSKKFCGKDATDLERKFIKSLHEANTFKIKDNTLTLYNNQTIILTALKKRATKKDTTVAVNSYRTITYKAMARGALEYIKISKSKVVLSTDKTLQNKEEYTCNSKDWEDLRKLLSAINPETFLNLKAPTSKRFYDGAAHTTVSYVIDDMVFATPTFDEGYPPKEIEALVNKILSIKQNVIKQ